VTDAPYEPMFVDGPPYGASSGVVGKPPRRFAGAAIVAVAVTVLVSAAGGAIGWIWAEVSPRVVVIKSEQGFLYADAEPEQAMAGDGWFAVLGAAAGLMFAVLAWSLLRRYRGPVTLFALTLGSLIGGMLAWWVGHKIGLAQFDQARQAAPLGARLDAPLGLRITNLSRDHPWVPLITGVAAIQALVAAATYTVLAGFSGYSDLRGETLPAYSLPSYQPPSHQPAGTDQFGPGFTGSSDSATGTART
jgi:membrane protein YqaA with SNARE-associated domain